MAYEMASITAFHRRDPLRPAGEHPPSPIFSSREGENHR
jgi:hypothetical protein